MRSPRRVCSRGSSHTAHSLPTKVRSRLERLRSAFEDMTLLSIPPTRRELLLSPECTEPVEETESCPRRDLELIDCVSVNGLESEPVWGLRLLDLEARELDKPNSRRFTASALSSSRVFTDAVS